MAPGLPPAARVRLMTETQIWICSLAVDGGAVPQTASTRRSTNTTRLGSGNNMERTILCRGANDSWPVAPMTSSGPRMRNRNRLLLPATNSGQHVG